MWLSNKLTRCEQCVGGVSALVAGLVPWLLLRAGRVRKEMTCIFGWHGDVLRLDGKQQPYRKEKSPVGFRRIDNKSYWCDAALQGHC